MDKTAIKNFAIEARKILMKTAITEAGFYGITKDEIKSPIQKGNDFEVYETLAGTENRIFGADIKRRANLVNAIKELGFDQVIEETAYTWFNRIIAIRFMEVNNYLPTKVRVLSSETGNNAPDIISQADTVDLNLTSDELEAIQTAKRENRYDDAFRLLFIKQCNELNDILPGLFEKTDDYMELLLKISYTSDGVVRMLVDSVPEDNFNVETEGQVEIIGWMYQYYNTELKDDTFAKLKKNVKITKERIPAATQLFTPDWIVRYMVENSLGRVWIEHLRAISPDLDEKAVAEEFGWKYYFPEASQEHDVATQLVEIRSTYKDMTPQDITCIDPCMGSGHILVYMFDVLMDIYRSEGFSERDSVFDILEKNIRGLDIDRRAYQLSYFALMMKARGYNRIFFRGHEDIEGNRIPVNPKVFAIEESNFIDRNQLSYYGAGLDDMEKNKAINEMNGLLDTLIDAREYGSILNVDNYDWDLLRKFVLDLNDGGQLSLISYAAGKSQKLLNHLVDIGETLSKKYDAVITNPPYMSANNMAPKLVEFIKNNYESYKADFFSAFIVKCTKMTRYDGKLGFLTPYVWMFILSYEALREYITSRCIETLIQFEYSAFEEATVPVCTFAFSNIKCKKKGCYLRLTDFKGGMEVQREKTLEALNDSCNYYFERESDKFNLIPGNPIAYWVSDSFFDVFKKSHSLGDIAPTKKGLDTGNNNKYLRLWFEVAMEKLGIGYNNSNEFTADKMKWAPHDKGGDYRRWYGNKDWVINWENNGAELHNSKANLRSERFYFSKALTWGSLSSGKINFRYSDYGALSNTAGSSLYPNDNDFFYLLGLLNSKAIQYVLDIISPTLNYSAGPVSQIPIVESSYRDRITFLAKECVDIAKEDWNAFENSWDYKEHPFARISKTLWDDTATTALMNKYYKKTINCSCPLELCFLIWNGECEERFNKVKENEEELNRIVINLYNLQDELAPTVEEKDISIRKADLSREIKSFISYAVGCMFGRYSIKKPGLICAGGELDLNNYGDFGVDVDNIIPITDEEYFEDDIVKRFEDFLIYMFGKESLDSNLTFIAKALGKRHTTSREAIRDYFLNDYYKDHTNLYAVSGSGKRPIYWLFDSGKQNGFKCLIYIHRYTSDTVGRIRSDYLSIAQNMIENALKNAEYAINKSASAVDKAQATKARDKYVKQLAEIKAYYPALSHVALQRIEIDLDDGVKANYAKFQGIEVSIEGEKNRTVDLLAKI